MSKKGFQNMDKEKHIEAARKGGKNSRNRYKWNSEEARLAGIRGAEKRWGKQRMLDNGKKEEC